MENLTILLLSLMLPAIAVTGDRFDVYGGAAPLAADALVDISTNNPTSPLPRNRARFDPRMGGISGLRWREESMGWGLALDIAYQRARSDGADVKLMPITLGVALPSRLTLAGRPGQGSLHPTGMLGITVTGIGGESRLLGEADSPVGADIVFPLDNGRPGFVATAGLEWRPSPRFALFTEYRYQYLRFHETAERGSFFGPTWQYDASGSFRDQRLVFGLSIPYGSASGSPAPPSPAAPADRTAPEAQ